MRVLVTGGAGFIGSHFSRLWLARHPSDRIVNLDLLTYAGSRERLADLEGSMGYIFVRGSIGDPDAVKTAMQACDVVVHFAAETHVDRSITDPAPFLRTNIEGTAILLDAARKEGVTRFLHVSTDEVYGPVLEGAVDERAPLAPRSPYAASKAAADLLVQAAWATHSLPVMLVRPTNIYGPAQFVEKFIPLVTVNSLEGLPVPIYGDGQHRRAWLHVRDVCEAIHTVLDKGRRGECYNIAGGTEQPNLETARAIVKLLGGSPGNLRHVSDRPGHDRRYAMDDAKLRALGWRPHIGFEQGLADTVAWYRDHQEWWRPLAKRLREDPYHWLNRPARASAQQPSGAIR